MLLTHLHLVDLLVPELEIGSKLLDSVGLVSGGEVFTSLELPTLCLFSEVSLVRSSLCLLSSASLAFFARISSRRCCIILATQAHAAGFGAVNLYGC